MRTRIATAMLLFALLASININSQDFEYDYDFLYDIGSATLAIQILDEEALTCQITGGGYLNCENPDIIIPEKVINPNNGKEYSIIDITAFTEYSKNTYWDISSIILPPTLKRIGHSSFMLIALGHIEIPNSVEEIDTYAFLGTHISSIVIPESVKSFGASTFNGSTISEITLPSEMEDFGYDTFRNCGCLKTIVLPEGLEFIPCGAFWGCINLVHIDLGKTLKGIDSYAFCGCNQLLEISLPEELEYINPDGFSYSNIRNIELPRSIKYIGYGAFQDCKLEYIKSHIEDPEAIETDLTAFDGCDFEGCVLYVPAGTKEKYERTAPWNYFAHILEMGTEGIEGIATDADTRPTEYYDLTGRRVNSPSRGLYLDNKGSKILVK